MPRFEQLQATPEVIDKLLEDLLLDDWPEGIFDTEKDQDALSWRLEAERVLGEARGQLARAARTVAEKGKSPLEKIVDLPIGVNVRSRHRPSIRSCRPHWPNRA